MDGQEHRDERRGRPSVAYGPCRRELPSFDLVVATVGRLGELARLLASVEAQGPQLRVIVVDQNDDNRLAKVRRTGPRAPSPAIRAGPLARA